MERIFLIVYLLVINFVAFIFYAVDKRRARRQQYRISEATLISLVSLGGGFGALAGIWLLRHKTRHKKFTIGVPAIMMAQVAFVLWLMADPY